MLNTAGLHHERNASSLRRLLHCPNPSLHHCGVTLMTVLTKNQKLKFGPVRLGSGDYKNCLITATVRHDDECGNGHNTFSITGDVKESNRWVAGGCLHKEIARAFPQLAPCVKWHLTSTDGPMHYIANTLYHVSDRDCWGLRKGETKQIHNGKTGLPCWILKGPGTEYKDSLEKPTGFVSVNWEPLTRTGEGKARELDHARSCAVWPDATDEELLADDLKARLLARHAKLMTDFRTAVESLGMVY
jgi:hypothetical protein